MKITTKGQVTIPQGIRKELGLRPGTDVDVVAEDGRVVLRKKRGRNGPVADWLRQATGIAHDRCTTDQIMQLTRGED